MLDQLVLPKIIFPYLSPTMKKLFFFFFTFLFTSALLNAQWDSTQLKEKIDDAGRLINKQPDSAMILIEELMGMGKAENDYALMSEAIKLKGIAHKRKSEFGLSEKCFREAVSFAQLAGDSLLVANAKYSLGLLYRHLAKYSESLTLYNESLNLAFNYEAEPIFIARIYNGMGTVLHATEQFAESVEYFKKSFSIHKKENNASNAASSAVNIGGLLVETEQFDSATYYLNYALDYYKNKNYKFGEAAAQVNLAEVYLKKEELDKAKKYSEDALQVFKDIGDEARVGMTLSSLSKIENKLGNRQKAILYAEESLAIAEKVGRLDNAREQYYDLSKIYAETGQWQQAYEAQVGYNTLNDSMFYIEIDEILQEQRAKFETAEKDQEITRLNLEQALEERQQKRLLIGLLLFAALALLAFLFYLGRRRAIKKLQKEQAITNNLLKEKLLTELKQAQASLVQNEKMVSLGQLTAGIAHEINNPINFITSAAAALQLNFADIQKILEKIASIKNKADKEKAINELINLSEKLES